MTTLSQLTLDFFLLGHAHLAAGQAGDGLAFERRVRAHLQMLSKPHGLDFRVLGRHSLSGLYHQLDEQTSCDQALVVGEWKAYTGEIPKNEVLRFKAATDDYWLTGHADDVLPLVRVFGGTGSASAKLQSYCALWGIALITPELWPVPALCDPHLLWEAGDLPSPRGADLRALTGLVRPMGSLLKPQSDGSWLLPKLPSPPQIAGSCHVWRQWSDQAWEWWNDARPARFESLLANRVNQRAA